MDFILSQLAEILVPLGIVVVLPVLIVWLDMRKKANDTNKRTEIVLAAIEKNSEIDVEDFFKKMNPPQKTLKEKLMQRFLWGTVFVALGVSLIGFVLIRTLWGGAAINDVMLLGVWLLVLLVSLSYSLIGLVGKYWRRNWSLKVKKRCGEPRTVHTMGGAGAGIFAALPVGSVCR